MRRHCCEGPSDGLNSLQYIQLTLSCATRVQSQGCIQILRGDAASVASSSRQIQQTLFRTSLTPGGLLFVHLDIFGDSDDAGVTGLVIVASSGGVRNAGFKVRTAVKTWTAISLLGSVSSGVGHGGLWSRRECVFPKLCWLSTLDPHSSKHLSPSMKPAFLGECVIHHLSRTLVGEIQ